ncbi:hypothetical protein ACN38_g4841 [Penicillium nordicum]|uniref:Uncharacterized protein n=1 Tax=Penicillium nordicum TaxID=229535 RepID=A0A0M9WGQ5_9EURO|nr:hypothetical protein ACN38_g4841 [Penicillium nordicum]
MSSGILFNSHDLNDIKCTPCFPQPGVNIISRFLHVISWGLDRALFRPIRYYPSIHGWVNIYPCWSFSVPRAITPDDVKAEHQRQSLIPRGRKSQLSLSIGYCTAGCPPHVYSIASRDQCHHP